jgi:hypothetical protein
MPGTDARQSFYAYSCLLLEMPEFPAWHASKGYSK